jgi:hypothetical protein
MLVDGLLIPELLKAAIDAGKWPRTADEGLKQNLDSLFAEDRIRRLAADESMIYLYSPPFTTVARAVARDVADGRSNFYAEFGAIHQLVPAAAVEIADFGLGSDSPILLDYRAGPTKPKVIRLWWPGDARPNQWVDIAPDFESFAEILGL